MKLWELFLICLAATVVLILLFIAGVYGVRKAWGATTVNQESRVVIYQIGDAGQGEIRKVCVDGHVYLISGKGGIVQAWERTIDGPMPQPCR